MAKKKQTEETIVDVQEVYTKTEMFIDRNRKTLTIVLGGIALLFIGFFAYRLLVKVPSENRAMEELWRAQMYFENDSTDLALVGDDLYPGFEDIASQHAGTKAGKLANYYMGIIYRDRAEYDVALEHFLQADFNDEVVGLLALGNAGDMYVETGDLAKAEETFKKAVSKAKASGSKEFAAPLYLYKLGIVQMELDKKADARKTFEDIRDNYPDASEWEKSTKYAASLSQY